MFKSGRSSSYDRGRRRPSSASPPSPSSNAEAGSGVLVVAVSIWNPLRIGLIPPVLSPVNAKLRSPLPSDVSVNIFQLSPAGTGVMPDESNTLRKFDALVVLVWTAVPLTVPPVVLPFASVRIVETPVKFPPCPSVVPAL